MTALSILIPARNEMFLARTIQDLLENMEADTEIIAVLDGAWADPGIPQHDKVNVIYVPESIGQRAATNLACKLAQGKYVMKLDAHCAFDKGFDRKMLEGFQKVGDDVTMVPIMRNLWVYDWKCYHCGWKKYQGPTPEKCEQCGKSDKIRRKMIWIGKHNPQSWSYCFDAKPHFQYNEAFKHTPEGKIGAIIGYKLFIDTTMVPVEIINLLANFARSHQFSCSGNSFRLWQNMAINTMGFSSVDDGGSIRTTKVFLIGNEPEMERIATLPVLTDVVNYGYILASSAGNGSNQPCIGESVCEGFLLELGTPTITPTINTPCPNPTTRRTINSDMLNEFNGILGGEFVYSETRKSFHNGSVSLIPMHDKQITETMSLQGSCFMATREKFWELNLCDESLGSWGNQGLEVACKTWLSGGRVLVNHNTWYAHLFRTQGGDFSFPYPQSGRGVVRTKNKTWNLFFNGNWDKQILPMSWLVTKFWPVPGWSEEDLNSLIQRENLGE